MLKHTAALRAVAWWNGGLWVASGGDDGLCQLTDGELVSLKPNVKATHLDARHDLLISCPYAVIETLDD